MAEKLKSFHINYKGKRTLVSVVKFKRKYKGKPKYAFTYTSDKHMRIIGIRAKTKPEAMKKFKKIVK